MITNSWACPFCSVWLEDAITVEHLERAALQHVDTEHPSYRLIVRHAFTTGLHPKPLFDSVVTAEGETTTCVRCGAGITIEPADPESALLQSFKNEHVARHADGIREGRAS